MVKTRGATFSRRVMSIWNELPEEGVKVGTITTFKIYLARYIDWKGLQDYMDQMWASGTSLHWAFWSVWMGAEWHVFIFPP